MKRLFHKKKKKRHSELQQPYTIRPNSNRDQKLDPPGRRRSMPSFTTPSAEDSDFSIDPTAAFLGYMNGSTRPTGGGGSTAGMSSSMGNAPEYRDTRGKRRVKQGASNPYEDLHHHRHEETKEEEKEPTEFQLSFGTNEFDTSDEDARGEDDDSFGADELLPSMAQMGCPPPTATSAESSISALSNSYNNHHHSMTASASILRQDKIADRKMRGGSSNNHHNNSYSSRHNNSSSSRYNSSQRSGSQRSVSISNHSSGHVTVDFSRRRYAETDDELEDEDTVAYYDDGTQDHSKLERAYKNLQEAQRNMEKDSTRVKRTSLARENSPKPRRSTRKDYSSSSVSKIQTHQNIANSSSRRRRSSLTPPRKSSTKQRKKTRRASLGSPTSPSNKKSDDDDISHSLGEIEDCVRMLHKKDIKTREYRETLQHNSGLQQPPDQTAINTSINSGTGNNTRMMMKNSANNMNTSKINKFDTSMNFNDLQSSVRFDHNSHSVPNLPTRRRRGSANDSNMLMINSSSNSNNHAQKGMSHSMNDISHVKNASRRSTVDNNSMHLNARAASRFGALENKINKRRHDFSRLHNGTTEDLEMSQSLNDATRLLAKEGKEGSRRRRRHSIGETGSGDMVAPEPMPSLQKHSRRSLMALGSSGRNNMTTNDSSSSLDAFQQHQQQVSAWQNNKTDREALPTLLEAQSVHHRHPTKHPTRTTDLSSKPSSSKRSTSKPRRSMKEQEFLDKYGDDDDQSTLDNSMKETSKKKHKKKRKGSLSPSWRQRLVHSLGGKKKKDRKKEESAKSGVAGGKIKNRRRRQSIGSSRDLLVQRENRQRRPSLEIRRTSDVENPLRRSHTAELHVDHSTRTHTSRVKSHEAAFRRSHTGTEIDRRKSTSRGMENSHNDHRIKTSGRRSNRHSRDVSTSRNRTSKSTRENMDFSGRITSNNDHMKTDFGEVVGDDEMATLDSSSKRATSKRSGRSRSLRPKMRTIKNFVGL